MQFHSQHSIEVESSLINKKVFDGGKLLYGRSLDNIIAKLSKERVFKKRNRILLVSERSNACLSLSSDDEQEEKSPDLHQCGQCHRMFSSLSSYITHRLERPCCVRNNINRYAEKGVRSLSPLENHRIKEKNENSDQEEEDGNEFLVQEIHKRKHDRKGTARKLQAGGLLSDQKLGDGVEVITSAGDLASEIEGGDSRSPLEGNGAEKSTNDDHINRELHDQDRTPRVYPLGDEGTFPSSYKEGEQFDHGKSIEAERRGEKTRSTNEMSDSDNETEKKKTGKEGDQISFQRRYHEQQCPDPPPPRFGYSSRQGEMPPHLPFYDPGFPGPLLPSRFRGPVPYSFVQVPPNEMEYPEMYKGGRPSDFGGPYQTVEAGMEKPPNFNTDMRLNNLMPRDYAMCMGGRYKDRYRPPPLDFPGMYARYDGDPRGASNYSALPPSPPGGRSREPHPLNENKTDMETDGLQGSPERAYPKAIAEPSSEEKVSGDSEERQEQAPKPGTSFYRNYGSGGPPELVRIPTPHKGQASQSPGDVVRASTSLAEERTPSSLNMNEEQSKSSTYSLSPSSSGKNTEQGSSNVSSPALPESNADGSPFSEIATSVGPDGLPAPSAKFQDRKSFDESSDVRDRSLSSGINTLSPPPLQLPTFARLGMSKAMSDDGPSEGGKEIDSRMSKGDKFSMAQDESSGDPSWRHAKQVYRCPLCAKIFPFKSKLQRHVLVHTGIKPYKCTVCGRGFTQQIDLQRHVTRHTGEKPFKCHLCKAQFIRADNLRKHAKDTHFVNIEEPVRKRRRKTTGSDTVLPPLEVAIAMAINEAEKNGGRILGRTSNKFANSRFDHRNPTMNERVNEKYKGDMPPEMMHNVPPRGQMMPESQGARPGPFVPDGMQPQSSSNRYPPDPYKEYRGEMMRYPPNFSPAREVYGGHGRYGYLPSPGREKPPPPWPMSRPPSLISPGDVAKYANELRTKRERLESTTSEGASVIVENEIPQLRPPTKDDDDDSRLEVEMSDFGRNRQRSPPSNVDSNDKGDSRIDQVSHVDSHGNMYDSRNSEEHTDGHETQQEETVRVSPSKHSYNYDESMKLSSDRNHSSTARRPFEFGKSEDESRPVEVTIVKDVSPSMDPAYHNLPSSVIDSSEVS